MMRAAGTEQMVVFRLGKRARRKIGQNGIDIAMKGYGKTFGEALDSLLFDSTGFRLACTIASVRSLVSSGPSGVGLDRDRPA
jgi:hypothetical protein